MTRTGLYCSAGPDTEVKLSASQTLCVSIFTIYSVHSSKVCRPVAGGGATVAPFCIKWRHHGATLIGN